MVVKLCCLASEEHHFGPKICYIAKKCFSFWEGKGGGGGGGGAGSVI